MAVFSVVYAEKLRAGVEAKRPELYQGETESQFGRRLRHGLALHRAENCSNPTRSAPKLSDVERTKLPKPQRQWARMYSNG